MSLRTANRARLQSEVFDCLIVGGGINGAVAAAALAGQGARVALIDRLDFAGLTSQESSNLVWGGIKYLESWDLALVRKLCLGRNKMLRCYPSRVQEIRFLATVDRGFRFRPRSLWLAAWAYWLLGNGRTRPPRLLGRAAIAREEPAVGIGHVLGGFEYSDAYLPDNDARFVFQLVRSAMDKGCAAVNYLESLSARREGDLWSTGCRDTLNGADLTIRSRILINAAGPYADAHNRLTGIETEHRHLFSKGIHLIVPRITESQRVLTFFADDGRLFFAIPMAGRTCIGTTDTPVSDPQTQVTEADRAFVLGNINKRLRLPKPLTQADVLAERCGVRPLAVTRRSDREAHDWLALSRRHAIDVDRTRAHIAIFGGKLTDCLNVGEEVLRIVDRLGVAFPHPTGRWYGEPDAAERAELLRQCRALPLAGDPSDPSAEPTSERLWRRYDRHAFGLLDAIRADPREAEVPMSGIGLMRCEIALMARREMIAKLDDFLRRRTPIALLIRPEEIRRAAGLEDTCSILFGNDSAERIAEYFGTGAAAPRSDSGDARPPL